MKMTAHGWGRNMGNKELADIDLSQLEMKTDENRYLRWNNSALFAVTSRHPHNYGSITGAEVHWTQSVKMTGDYRLKVGFSRSDVMQLFKSVFGTTLTMSLLEDYGFVVSDKLRKHILGTVKLTDLTLADLAGINTPFDELPARPAQKPSLQSV
jgi:hypothetical protein